MVLATSVTTTTFMLSVLANTTVTVADVSLFFKKENGEGKGEGERAKGFRIGDAG